MTRTHHKHPRIGAHVSAAGGVYRAFQNAEAIGAECMQIFGASPRQWGVKVPDAKEVEAYHAARRASSVRPAYLHAAYLVNLASRDADLVRKSVANLTGHLKIASMIGAEGLIFHVGSAGKGGEKKEALKGEVNAVKAVLKNVPGPAKLFLENTAGGGGKVGSVEDIAFLVRRIKNARVKVCLDTAHAFESGLIERYTPDALKTMHAVWNNAVGLDAIEVLHVNDSKTKSGSHHDRHENIGEGEIGTEGFRALAASAFARVPAWILEVPGFNDEGPDAKNIARLRTLFT